MIEKLLPLLGKSIQSEEIKTLFEEWNAVYPRKPYCTPNEPNLKVKVERDCIRLYFRLGGNSRYMKPIPAHWDGGFIAQFTMMEFTKKRKGGIPFDVEFSMTAEELTAILGEPVVTNFVGTTTTWRRNLTDKHEFIVSDTGDGDDILRSMTLTFIYEKDLNSMEEYEQAGL